MQGIYGHGSLYTLFAQTTKTPVHYTGNMRTRNIRISIFVTGLIIQIGNIRIIRHRIIKFYHRILRLADIQLIKAFRIFGINIIIQVFRQLISTT